MPVLEQPTPTVAPDNPVGYNRRDVRTLSARLLLAHLEEDHDTRWFYRDLVQHESGLASDAFMLADSAAEHFARYYQTPASRERARKELLGFLEKR